MNKQDKINMIQTMTGAELLDLYTALAGKEYFSLNESEQENRTLLHEEILKRLG